MVGGGAKATQPCKTYTKGRTKVKTGCRTCKIRKVKCDEGYPACKRCVSTSRVCDGYGIWGGGTSGNHRQAANAALSDGTVAPRPQASISTLVIHTTDENRHFEWFRCGTSKKIPGMFVMAFWEKLVFQASMNEPAVLHAVLTLSSVHKTDSFRPSHQFLDKHEQFMLQHYTKAITNLQPHFAAKGRSSVRVALITCLLFIFLECLRGHLKTAQVHLQNGLRVLNEMQGFASTADDKLLVMTPSKGSIEDWIVEAFCRLQVQVILLNQSHWHQPLIIQKPCEHELSMAPYSSLNETWKSLERLFTTIFHLTEQGRRQQISDGPNLKYPSALLELQQRIQEDLDQWFDTFETSKAILESQDPAGGRACPLLYTYYKMATIMASSCLQLDDESVFDSHTEQFVSLIQHSIKLRKIGSSVRLALSLPAYITSISRSIVDIGWIPPLYYTALKCRNHRVRLQALRLLETTDHREGIWDSKIAACVARKVMEIEEGGFYRDVHMTDDFSLSSSPSMWDLALPTLPASRRVQDVEVILADGPTESIFLSYKQKQPGGEWKVLMKEYSPLSQCWVDDKGDRSVDT